MNAEMFEPQSTTANHATTQTDQRLINPLDMGEIVKVVDMSLDALAESERLRDLFEEGREAVKQENVRQAFIDVLRSNAGEEKEFLVKPDSAVYGASGAAATSFIKTLVQKDSPLLTVNIELTLHDTNGMVYSSWIQQLRSEITGILMASILSVKPEFGKEVKS